VGGTIYAASPPFPYFIKTYHVFCPGIAAIPPPNPVNWTGLAPDRGLVVWRHECDDSLHDMQYSRPRWRAGWRCRHSRCSARVVDGGCDGHPRHPRSARYPRPSDRSTYGRRANCDQLVLVAATPASRRRTPSVPRRRRRRPRSTRSSSPASGITSTASTSPTRWHQHSARRAAGHGERDHRRFS
jgi:hypothetical protein